MAADYAATIKKYINVLAHEGGSDLHLSSGAHPTIRVSGQLAPMIKEEQEKKFLETREADFAYETPEGIRFRGNAFFERGAISIALRLIPKQIKTVAELNLPDVLTSFARKSQGFF